jgi:serine/threonine-protein kinase
VFSLGLVAYFLLCGEAPFHSEDTYADMYRQIHDPIPPIDTRRNPMLRAPSYELVAVIERCLEKEPADRYADAGDVLQALKATPEHGRWRPPIRQVQSGARAMPPLRPEDLDEDAHGLAGPRREVVAK